MTWFPPQGDAMVDVQAGIDTLTGGVGGRGVHGAQKLHSALLPDIFLAFFSVVFYIEKVKLRIHRRGDMVHVLYRLSL